MIDPAGKTGYAYSDTGRVIKETRAMEGITYTTRYGYDDSGNHRRMTYPSGLIIEYGEGRKRED